MGTSQGTVILNPGPREGMQKGIYGGLSANTCKEKLSPGELSNTVCHELPGRDTRGNSCPPPVHLSCRPQLASCFVKSISQAALFCFVWGGEVVLEPRTLFMLSSALSLLTATAPTLISI